MKSRNFKALMAYTILMDTYYLLFFYSRLDWIYTKGFCALITVCTFIWLICDLLRYSDIQNRQSRIILLTCMAMNTVICSLISLDVILNGRLCLFVFNGLTFAISASLFRNLNKYGYFK
jgi:hypothetical protein